VTPVERVKTSVERMLGSGLPLQQRSSGGFGTGVTLEYFEWFANSTPQV
jgi:hypothetical protein